MLEMFRTMFGAITALFRAAEKGANSLDHVAAWAEDESAAFRDQAAIERQARLEELEKSLKLVS